MSIYADLTSEPHLRAITTLDPHATRFHACERFNRCECVDPEDLDVVYVNAVEVSTLGWDRWRTEAELRLLNGERITSLVSNLNSLHILTYSHAYR
jgi:hypothetical protein